MKGTRILKYSLVVIAVIEMAVLILVNIPLPSCRLFHHALFYKSPHNQGWFGTRFDLFLKPQSQWPRLVLVWVEVWDATIQKSRPSVEMYDPLKHTPQGAQPVPVDEITALYNTSPNAVLYPIHKLRQLGIKELPPNDFRFPLMVLLLEKGWEPDQSIEFCRGSVWLDPNWPSERGTIYEIRNSAFCMLPLWQIFCGVALILCGSIFLVFPTAVPKAFSARRRFIGSVLLAIGLCTELISIGVVLVARSRTSFVTSEGFFYSEYPRPFLYSFADAHRLSLLLSIVVVTLGAIVVVILRKLTRKRLA